MEKPKILTLDNLVGNLWRESLSGDDTLYLNEGLAVVAGGNRAIRKFARPRSPYLIEDYRMALITSGRLHGNINLKEYVAEAGSLMFITPGSFVEPLDISDDFRLFGMGMTVEMFGHVLKSQMPELFNGRVKEGRLVASSDEFPLLLKMFQTLCALVSSSHRCQAAIHSMAASLVWQVDGLFAKQDDEHFVAKKSAGAIFDRFIYLVNTNAREHRRLDFYAGKMCITERYLGTVVSQVSGTTAKEWIDRAVITNAKVMLRHGNSQVGQIADYLNFPNASFFCKYFRRLVGCTPQEYREGRDGYSKLNTL